MPSRSWMALSGRLVPFWEYGDPEGSRISLQVSVLTGWALTSSGVQPGCPRLTRYNRVVGNPRRV